MARGGHGVLSGRLDFPKRETQGLRGHIAYWRSLVGPYLRSLTMNANTVRCLLISDFTIDGLVPFLAAESEAPAFTSEVAPFDQVMQVLLDEQRDCWRLKPEMAVVWTRPHAAIKSFARLLNVEPVPT